MFRHVAVFYSHCMVWRKTRFCLISLVNSLTFPMSAHVGVGVREIPVYCAGFTCDEVHPFTFSLLISLSDTNVWINISPPSGQGLKHFPHILDTLVTTRRNVPQDHSCLGEPSHHWLMGNEVSMNSQCTELPYWRISLQPLERFIFLSGKVWRFHSYPWSSGRDMLWLSILHYFPHLCVCPTLPCPCCSDPPHQGTKRAPELLAMSNSYISSVRSKCRHVQVLITPPFIFPMETE